MFNVNRTTPYTCHSTESESQKAKRRLFTTNHNIIIFTSSNCKTTMDLPTRRPVELLNAQVGQFLANGKFVEAAETARDALRMMLPHVLASGDESGDDSTGSEPDGTFHRLYQIPAQSPIGKADERIFSLFAQAFLCQSWIDDDVVALSPVWNVDEWRRVAASTVYNMGLAYHLEGLRGHDQRPLFDKALKAYRASAALLGSAVEDVSTEDDDVKLLCLAIANNQGCINEHLFDGPSIRSCLQELHATLAQTWWSKESAHFHTTGILFPTWESASLLHSPAA